MRARAQNNERTRYESSPLRVTIDATECGRTLFLVVLEIHMATSNPMVSQQAFIPPPCDFLCPITQEIMLNPVLLIEDVSELARAAPDLTRARVPLGSFLRTVGDRTLAKQSQLLAHDQSTSE